MPRPRPLFLMGNKRSGSTLTVNLINAHPRIFVSHESDIAWILYQARDGQPDQYQIHELDSAMMMRSTLRNCRSILNATLESNPTTEQLADAFYEVQYRLMNNWLNKRVSFRGVLWRRIRAMGRRPSMAKIRRAWNIKPAPMHKECLSWIGDKKHAQHLDPKLREFMRETFPDARHVHIVRDPRGVVASMVEAKKSWWVMPDYFKGSAEQILDQWAQHEEWVIEAREKHADEIYTVRLEDLCMRPVETLEGVLHFLDLEMTSDTRDRVESLVNPRDPNAKYASFPLPDTSRSRRIKELYGYA